MTEIMRDLGPRRRVRIQCPPHMKQVERDNFKPGQDENPQRKLGSRNIHIDIEKVFDSVENGRFVEA
ncbi:hypothetical protein M8J77_008801 [Diaphorina citri]|nr:hypothetical protein M8J77_008801 [Diaphorina citri]